MNRKNLNYKCLTKTPSDEGRKRQYKKDKNSRIKTAILKLKEQHLSCCVINMFYFTKIY